MVGVSPHLRAQRHYVARAAASLGVLPAPAAAAAAADVTPGTATQHSMGSVVGSLGSPGRCCAHGRMQPPNATSAGIRAHDQPRRRSHGRTAGPSLRRGSADPSECRRAPTGGAGGRKPAPGRAGKDRSGPDEAYVSTTTGTIIGLRRSLRLTQEPMVRRTTCCSWWVVCSLSCCSASVSALATLGLMFLNT